MGNPPQALDFVVCPQCHGGLKFTKEKVLLCVSCRLCFPLEDGIPNLTMEASMPLSADGKVLVQEKVALFTIEKGLDTGKHFRLGAGSCKAIGRKIEDANQTQVFNVDFTMSLDEQTKKVIQNYISTGGGGDLGNFKRLPDLILNDQAISRLHAMVFYDQAVGVGILDLVSRNGTFVNEKEVETKLLTQGDEIRIGSTIISYSLG